MSKPLEGNVLSQFVVVIYLVGLPEHGRWFVKQADDVSDVQLNSLGKIGSVHRAANDFCRRHEDCHFPFFVFGILIVVTADGCVVFVVDDASCGIVAEPSQPGRGAFAWFHELTPLKISAVRSRSGDRIDVSKTKRRQRREVVWVC